MGLGSQGPSRRGADNAGSGAGHHDLHLRGITRLPVRRAHLHALRRVDAFDDRTNLSFRVAPGGGAGRRSGRFFQLYLGHAGGGCPQTKGERRGHGGQGHRELGGYGAQFLGPRARPRRPTRSTTQNDTNGHSLFSLSVLIFQSFLPVTIRPGPIFYSPTAGPYSPQSRGRYAQCP